MLFKTRHICLTLRCMNFGVECLGWLCCAYSFTHTQLFVTLWTVAFQAPLSMEILQARTLEWIATPSSKGSSQPSDWTHISCIAGGFITIWATTEALSFFAFCYWQPTPVCFPGEFSWTEEHVLLYHRPWGRRVRHEWVTNTLNLKQMSKLSEFILLIFKSGAIPGPVLWFYCEEDRSTDWQTIHNVTTLEKKKKNLNFLYLGSYSWVNY